MAAQEGDPKLVAFCGLYCGECRQYKRGKCPGCAGIAQAERCQIRTCSTCYLHMIEANPSQGPLYD